MTPGYAGQRIALLTQHGKESVIAPVLEPALGCVVARVSGFDTDRLGTFTRDVPRPGSQREAARRKARIGMSLSGLPVGLASEGSVVPDPLSGLFPWSVELLVLIDDRLGIEVVASAQGPARSGCLSTGDWEALEAFARREDFPAHRLVLRPQDQDDPRLCKGLSGWRALRDAFERCLAESANGLVFVETDLRAFANPTRMQRIGEAAQDLLARLRSRCLACDLPGFGVAERRPGLPCAECGLPTRAWLAEVRQCVGCGHRTVAVRGDEVVAQARHCEACNP